MCARARVIEAVPASQARATVYCGKVRLTQLFIPALIPALLAACNTTPASTASDTDTASGTGSSSGTTQGSSPTTGASATDASTGAPTGGSGGMTEGGTTTATSTSTSTSTATSTTTETSGSETGTTSPVDTGPQETSSSTTGVETTDGGSSSSSTGGDTSTGEDSSTGEAEACACPKLEVALDDGIFLLSQSAELWKFFPETKMLENFGPVGCGLPPATFSMAVDRLGFAWVQYADGKLRKVDVTNVANCSDPGFVPNQQGVNNFGMAFVSNSAADKCDQIFGDQYTGVAEAPNAADFFRIDPMTQQIVKLGKTNFGTAEVTGTGDGRVFLFAAKAFDTQLVEVDKANGAMLSTIPLPGVQLGGGWAFAQFAGDFYFFTDGQNDSKSEITHIDYDDSDANGKQDITVVVQNAPLKVVGAGVSTCAPTIPQ